MASKFPYVASAGPLTAVIRQLRDMFPEAVTAGTLQKWNLAPKNESYVIGVLKFLDLIDDEGKKNKESAKAFLEHDDAAFSKGLEPVVQKAYSELFDLHGAKAWTLEAPRLISFFRSAGESSSVVGKRQAGTFRALAALSGHGDVSQPQQRARNGNNDSAGKSTKPRKETKAPAVNAIGNDSKGRADVGLTVRIEVNLPGNGDKATYDAIFRSIRENLINV